MARSTSLAPTDTFVHRHIGPRPHDVAQMLETVGHDSLDALVDRAIPDSIRLQTPLSIGPGRGEAQLLSQLRETMERNGARRSLIGQGYYGCLVPAVVQRNILENPGWYTAYTPYQAEISQGRLEALLNFQTMLAQLTGLPLCNASLLDEATAAAEAMALSHRVLRGKRDGFVASADLHPQTLAVLQTRATGLGIELRIEADVAAAIDDDTCGVLVQYPDTYGRIVDPTPVIEAAHGTGALAVVASDPLALVLLRPPGELGADVVVGSAQRFGVPMGFGGPHAAFLTTSEAHKRHIPGRIIGVSKDAHGRTALRMAMQTREQHIRREKATSNICTAQVLLAVMASMYGVYHGPKGLQAIAARVHRATEALAHGLSSLGHEVDHAARFDTLRVRPKGGAAGVLATAAAAGYDLRPIDDATLGISLDEAVTEADLVALAGLFGSTDAAADVSSWLGDAGDGTLVAAHARTTPPLSHEVFSRYHAEHELLRYMHRLQSKDLSLTTSMIPLGSCTMKLNATSEMLPVTWPQMANVHPFTPPEYTSGYRAMIDELSKWLRDITGFAAVSLQPNAGAQGEYAGLLTITAYHQSRGHAHRNVCLIPVSAHGTNPASAVMAGMKVVVVACDKHGNIDVDDLRAKAEQHADHLSALMVTYPSTHGVFEARIKEICEVVHTHGGQVYLDGANMNAQVGLCRPGDYGADVCHLNLHKTFCIPHGGGGPGVGPIGVAAHLAPFLPGHPVIETGGEQAIGPVSAAPYGSAGILAISYMYIGLMGTEGLTEASRIAILNANYMAARLRGHFDVLYTGENGTVAHEFILDLRPFKTNAGIEAEDVAKRLIDYGFHAPTMSFPVAGTLMIEPTESESKAELDRLCDALIAIRAEIAKVADGTWPADDNPLVNAPHTAAEVTADEWTHPYARSEAAYCAPWSAEHKYWPPVSRVDNAYGDRNLVCLCPPVDAYEE